VLLLEAQAEDAGAAGGIMDMVNEGINVVLQAHHVYAVLASPMGAANPPKPWTVMMDESDQVLGEWLSQHRLSQLKVDDSCRFISQDFVVYTDRKASGRCRFVMPYMPLETSPHHPQLRSCGVGCPSGPADQYLRELLGGASDDYATLIAGAWFKSEEET